VNPVDVERLREIAEVEFADIVLEALVPDINELHRGDQLTAVSEQLSAFKSEIPGEPLRLTMRTRRWSVHSHLLGGRCSSQPLCGRCSPSP